MECKEAKEIINDPKKLRHIIGRPKEKELNELLLLTKATDQPYYAVNYALEQLKNNPQAKAFFTHLFECDSCMAEFGKRKTK